MYNVIDLPWISYAAHLGLYNACPASQLLDESIELLRENWITSGIDIHLRGNLVCIQN